MPPNSDCEALRDGLLAQPVNAVTSLSYTVVGVWLLTGVSRIPPAERPMQAAYGVALVATGLGSFAYHGPAPPGARWAHDVPIVALLLVITLQNLAALGRVRRRPAVLLALGGAGAAGVLLALAPDAFVLLGLAAAGAAAVTALGQRRRRGIGWAVAALAVGLLLNGFGRTGGPLCTPQSPFQPHAGWHLLSAVAAGLYARATTTLPRS